MIFVTTGSQLPFDRLVQTMDEIAPSLHDIKIIAQVCKTNYRTRHMETYNFLPPKEFASYFSAAKVIISHAGMGTIISALEQEKPIIVMPRLAKNGEVTTDHQLATVKYFEKHNYIYIAHDEAELKSKLLQVLKTDLTPLFKIKKYASDSLLDSLKSFIYT